MRKKLEVPEEAISGAAKKAEQAAKKTTKEAAKVKKPNSDYIRLDLKPAGEDLKALAVKRAGQISIAQGATVSTTAYIQQLIREDAKKHEGKRDKRQEIAEMLTRVDDKDLSAIETVIKGLCK